MDEKDVLIAQLKLEVARLKKAYLEIQSQLVQVQHTLVSKELTDAEAEVARLTSPDEGMRVV